MGSKCFWDSNTDNQATASFTNVRYEIHDYCSSLKNVFFLKMILGQRVLRGNGLCGISILKVQFIYKASNINEYTAVKLLSIIYCTVES